MIKINFERRLHVPQLAAGPPSPLRRTALALAACGRPACLALLVGGAVFCASLAMTAAPADAQAASAPVAADSTESGRLAMDEFSSRRHGAGSARHHAGRSKGDSNAGPRPGRQRILGGYKRGFFKKGTPGVTFLGRGGQEGGRHRNAVGKYGDGRFKKHTRTYTPGPSYKTRGHKYRTIAGRQPDGGYSYGSSYYAKRHRTIAGRQPDGGYSYGSSYYAKRQKSLDSRNKERYASDKRVKR